jgi:threonine/homoserine/homoserine lactone efflux protein
MLDPSTIVLFAVACLALTVTPGPDMMLIASRTVAQGRTAGFTTLAGIQAGTFVHALATGFGLSQLFVHVPAAYEAVRWIGAAYLIWLAWKIVRSARARFVQTDNVEPFAIRRMFIEGLLTNLLNPKMALFVLALLPQFFAPDAGSVVVQALVLATILNSIGLVVNCIVILLADHFGSRFVRSARMSAVANYLLGAVFAGLAARLAVASGP